MQAAPEETQAQIDLMRACGPLKTWSVVVTILGDLYHSRIERISGKALTALAGRMGLTPQALRVAVHRLKKDGWLDSEKMGRESLYFLTQMGREETARVRELVYARHRPPGQAALLVVAPPDLAAADFTETLPNGAFQIAPRVAVVTARGERLGEGYLAVPFTTGTLPAWICDLLASTQQRAEYDGLMRAISGICDAPPPCDLVDAMVLRLLILHHWRRLQLRQHPLANTLLPPNWEGEAAREAVWCALQNLPAPAEDVLAQAVARA
jgi:phenylacetic acid degradation operon negative regulatory protein